MKSEPVYLDELNSNSSSYKVKVKVIEKTRPTVSPNKKKITYQNVILEDDKGNKMRGTLFGDQVESYQEAFVYNGVYEISNAPIKPVDSKYKPPSGMLQYEMGFGRQIVIQPFGEGTGAPMPAYVCLGQIPRAASEADRFDVLGVVLYADNKVRTIRTKAGHETIMKDIVITDHSCDQPIPVTLWSDLAGADSTFFSAWAERFIIVGFTALKVYTALGFTLSTSMSTVIIEDPKGPRVKALQEWVDNHENILHDRRSRLLDIKDPAAERRMTTIARLKAKKTSNTLQAERLWLAVYIDDADLDQIYAYLACSKCRRCPDGVGKTFAGKTCPLRQCVICPRITFSCQLIDETGSLAVTTYTEDAERLLQASAADIFHMKHDEDYTAFENVKQRLKRRQFNVEVGPHNNLTRNNILQWVLKSVEQNSDNDGGNAIQNHTLGDPTTGKIDCVTTNDSTLCTEEGSEPKAQPQEHDAEHTSVPQHSNDRFTNPAHDSPENEESPSNTLDFVASNSSN